MVISASQTAPVDTVAQCAAWMALDLEIDRLSLRWSQIETTMAEKHDWFRLTQAQRRALPQAAEMYEIDERLKVLFRQRRLDLKGLVKLKAESLHAVASKLAVAARILQYEENTAQPLIAAAVRELAGARCEKCGVSLLPDLPARAVR